MLSIQRPGMLLMLLTIMSVSDVASAEDSVTKLHFQYSGFATLGLTKSGDENLGFYRDLEQRALFDGDWSLAVDSLIGVQLDAAYGDSFGGTLQLVGKDRIEDSLENSVEWAFLRYSLNPQWTVRAGRIGFDVFLMSEFRNVGFAYLWSRPPTEFYVPLPFNSFDGVDLAWSTGLWGGTLRAKVSAGNSESSFQVLGNLVDVEVNDIYRAMLGWESEDWQLRLSYTDCELGDEGDYFIGSAPLAEALVQLTPFWPEAANVVNDLYVSDPHIRYYAVGAAYNKTPWQILSEFSQTDPKVNLYPATLHGYISAGYQIRDVTPYVLFARAMPRDKKKQAPAAPVIASDPGLTETLALLQSATQSVYDAISADQRTVTAGVRWDIRYDLALKVQLDHTWIDRRGISLWEVRNIPDQDTEINTFSVNLNAIF